MTNNQMMADMVVPPTHYTQGVRFPDPSEIKIYDTTLRDGEQMPGVALSAKQKYVIARELSDIGCDIIDLGFPASSPSERAALQMVLRGREAGELREDLEILVMCRSTAEDIDTTIRVIREQGFSPRDVSMLIFTAASPLHVRFKLGPSLLRREGLKPDADPPLEFFHEANKRMVAEAIRYARNLGVSVVEFGAEDASRTAIPQLIDLVQTAVDAGASRYIFADTSGSLTPQSTELYCRALTAAFPAIGRVSHFHNDFDLATFNTIHGILNGFSIFSTTVNGIGERAGNAPLHSVVAALRYLYGVELPRFRYDRLWRIKGVVEDLTGIPVQVHEPVVGYNVYSHESGIHAHGTSISRNMYEPIPLEEVGGSTRFVFGKHSGVHAILDCLERHQDEIDAPIDREFATHILSGVKALRESLAQGSAAINQINDYYRNVQGLQVSERKVVQLAKEYAWFLESQRYALAGHGTARKSA